jgi:hypothetical protein
MMDPSLYNSPRRLFELYKELTGEDLLNSEQQNKKEGRKNE